MSFSLKNVLSLAAVAYSLGVEASSPSVLDKTPYLSPSLSAVLEKAHTGIYNYPTSLTQGIVPKNLHSHNDYWRDVPFYTALSVGCISIEADVWLVNGTLYVGHEISALTPGRTFESLYVKPILASLQAQNPNSSFVPSPTKNGLFDTSSGQTVYLFVDLKTDGLATWPYVVKALEPLRAGGWLSKANATTFTSGPITVIGTGNTPLSLVQPIVERDYFWDAQIPTLNTTFSNITALVSPIASTAFSAVIGPVRGTELNATQLAVLRSGVSIAHAKGIKVRYWDQPGWPIATRNSVWRTLWNEGVDLINVDDVQAAAGFADESSYW